MASAALLAMHGDCLAERTECQMKRSRRGVLGLLGASATDQQSWNAWRKIAKPPSVKLGETVAKLYCRDKAEKPYRGGAWDCFHGT
jgi:hypothetical protein